MRFSSKQIIAIPLLMMLALPAVAQSKIGADLYKQGKYSDAAAAFEEAIKNNSRDSVSYYYAGLCYQQMGNMGRAQAMYRQVLKLAPGTRMAQFAASILKKMDPSFKSESEMKSQATPDSKPDVVIIDATKSGDLKALDGLPPDVLKNVSAMMSKSKDSFVEPPTDPAELASLPEQARIFYRGDRGKILLPVEINGRRMEMLFDTGAPRVLVSKADLTKLGLKAPEGDPVGYTGGSSNTSKVPYWVITASIKVGPIKRDKVKVQVLGTNAADALLGQTFFKDFDYTIDHSAHAIDITRKGRSKLGMGYEVPFRFRELGNRIIVDVEINGKKMPAIYDTGNTASAFTFFSVDQAKRYGVNVPAYASVVHTVGVTGSGEGRLVYIDRVKLGPIDLSHVAAKVNWVKERPGSDDGKMLDAMSPPLLGYDLTKGYQYSIDMDKKVIRFLRR